MEASIYISGISISKIFIGEVSVMKNFDFVTSGPNDFSPSDEIRPKSRKNSANLHMDLPLRERIKKFFHLTILEASIQMDVHQDDLRKACREIGLGKFTIFHSNQ